MNTVRILILNSLAATLAGCSGGESEQSGTTEEQFDGLTSGKWEITSRMASMDLAQLDAAGEERAEEMMREERSNAMCLEISQRTEPPVTMLYATNEACSYKTFSMSKGRISATLQCPTDGSEPTRLSGRYDKKSFTVTVTKTLTGDDGASSERTYSASGRHKGNC